MSWIVTEADDGKDYGHVSSHPEGRGDICTTWGPNAKADAYLIAAAPSLLIQLKSARQMLANYAAYDERHGFADDAAFTRRRLINIDAAIASAQPEIAPTAKSEPSNVVQIGDQSPEPRTVVDAPQPADHDPAWGVEVGCSA